jgi:hypothetical protein
VQKLKWNVSIREVERLPSLKQTKPWLLDALGDDDAN